MSTEAELVQKCLQTHTAQVETYSPETDGMVIRYCGKGIKSITVLPCQNCSMTGFEAYKSGFVKTSIKTRVCTKCHGKKVFVQHKWW